MFDSGVGGLTVMREVEKRLPHEKIIYFGDTARHPYGEKSPENILRYAMENSAYLMNHKIKMLIIACNTAASAVSIEELQELLQIPVLDVIAPGAERAVQVSKNGKIAVLATKATVHSGAYQRKIRQLKPDAEITAIPCPLLAQLVEEGMHQHLATKLILQEYLKLLSKDVDTILLGCTHYPPLKDLIQEEVGPNITIVDSATTLAEKAAEILSLKSLASSESCISHQYFVSENPEKFRQNAERFLSKPVPKVELQ